MQNPTHQQHVGNVINHSVDGKKETHPNKAGCTQGNMSIYTICVCRLCQLPSIPKPEGGHWEIFPYKPRSLEVWLQHVFFAKVFV